MRVRLFLVFSISSLLTTLTAAPTPAPVGLGAVQEQEVQKMVRVTGQVRALNKAHLAPQVGGSIVEMMVRSGQTVLAEQPLLRLDDRITRSRINSARANLRSIDVQLDSQKRMVKDTRANLSDLEASRKALPGAVSLRQVREARLANTELEGRIAQLEAQRSVVLAEIEGLEVELSHHLISAPFAGTVVERHVSKGDFIGVGTTAITLSDPSSLEFHLDCPESVTFSSPPSQLSLSLASGQSLQGVDIKVSPVVDPRSKTWRLYGRIGTASTLARDGVSVEAEVPGSQRIKAITIPIDALLKNEAGAFVYKVVPGQMGEMALPIPVKVQFRTGGSVVVAPGGLAPGDRVVVEGNERLFPMMPVSPKAKL